MNALTRTRDYLARDRKAILTCVLWEAFIGLVPVPGVDDWAADKVLISTMQNIAEGHHVDVSEEVARIILGANQSVALVPMSSRWTRMAGAAVAKRVLRAFSAKLVSRAFIALSTAKKAQEMQATYTRLTLFAHYCARLHSGGPISPETGHALFTDIVAVQKNTKSNVGWLPFQRGARAALRATLDAPSSWLNVLTRGYWSRRTQHDVIAVEPESELDLALAAALAKEDGLFARAAAAIDVQLSSDFNPYLEQAIAEFEKRLSARKGLESVDADAI